MLTVILGAPGLAVAQRSAFVEGLIDLTTAVAGTFGDEGPRLGGALDRMAAGLDAWDREIRTLEADLNARAAGLPPAPAFQLHAIAAAAYVGRQRLAEGLREIDAALRIEPGHANLQELRALVLDASGRARDANDAFRAAWQHDSADPRKAYLFLRHSASGSTGEVAKAREVLAAAYRTVLAGGASRLTPFVQIDLLGDTPAAAPLLPHAAYAAGYRLIAAGEYRQAIAELRNAVAADPLVTDPASRDDAIARGIRALKQDRNAEAIASLETAVSRLTKSSEANRILGLAYWAGGQDDASLRHLEMAITANPRDERSRLTRARVLMKAGRVEDAETALRDTVREFPDSGPARWWLASLQEEIGDHTGARQSFERAATVVLAGRGALHASIGRLSRVDADFAAAINSIELVARVTPNDTHAHAMLGQLYLESGQIDDAFDELAVALLLDSRNAAAYASMGQVHLHAGRHQEAIAALRRALDLRPSDHQSRYALAHALFQTGDAWNGARELAAFERAQQEAIAGARREMAIEVLKEEARLRAAEGQHDRAVVLWQEAITREPANAASYTALAASLAAVGRVDTAIAQYEKALTLGGPTSIYRQLEVLYRVAGRSADSLRARTLAEQGRAEANPK